jgi:hypothetical protein
MPTIKQAASEFLPTNEQPSPASPDRRTAMGATSSNPH